MKVTLYTFHFSIARSLKIAVLQPGHYILMDTQHSHKQHSIIITTTEMQENTNEGSVVFPLQANVNQPISHCVQLVTRD